MVYWSRYGHNAKIVNYLKEQLTNKEHSAKVFKADETDASLLPEADVYIFSAAAEAFRLQKHMRKFLKDFTGFEGKKYGIINTHAMKRKNWLKSMDNPLSKKNMQKVAEIDFHIGEGQQTGEGLSEGWQGKLDEFIEKIM